MASADRAGWIEAALAVVVAATLNWFGNGLNPVWPLMWSAMLPVLWFALRGSQWATAVAAVASTLLGGLSMWHYLHSVLGAPAVVWIAAYGLGAVVMAAAVLLFRALVRRGRVWSALVAVPAMWVTCEYVRNLVTPHGSAGSFAYTQLRFLPFLQLASATGPWGMTFFLLLFQSAVAIGIFLWGTERRLALRVVGVGVGAVVAVLVFGAVRLAAPQGKTIRVGLISSDERAFATVADEGAPMEQLFRAYAAEAEKLAAQGAQAIVMPEKLGVVIEPEMSAMDGVLQATADKTGVAIVAGVVRVAKPLKYNEARVYVPHVQVASYDKEHMLPPFESDLEPGTSLTMLPRERGAIGVAICKDMDFARPARSYGEAGAGVLLVPAWDFFVDDAWHGHIAVMRGVEDGFSVVRSAKGGFLTVSDWRGRIVAEARSNSAPFATLIADVPAEHHATVYQRRGDWFAWVSVGLLVFVLLRVWL
ncbi:nitrilase-related carbon-nitrogen hydrolase [Edaphobacter aggregans]|uniref:nitrilase-related carbon-nitrogen hydrolase n=1 Tax=Edaphobacter aggregans TaxID=570835 RepID=UPI00055052A7|nr:nitrilase-related carbon-nitrogen hydrolase [Edaphobacter aggregans]